MSQLRTVTEAADQNSLLAAWRGATAEVWIFSLTFRRLALLLRLPERSDVLYVVGLGCRRISGSFSWKGAKVSISRIDHRLSENAAEDFNCIYDEDAHFELICSGGVVLVESTEILTSFDQFHLPDE